MNLFLIYLIIILTVLTRFLPHPENFAPITAIAIFAGAYLPKKQAVALPLLARFASDIFLGFFSWPVMVAVYASHLAGVAFGWWIRSAEPRSASLLDCNLSASRWSASPLRGEKDCNAGHGPALQAQGFTRQKWVKIFTSSLSASLIFFLATNFALLYSNYPHNLSGILQSYANALPFFRGTVLGDLTYTVVLFGVYQFSVYLQSQRQRAEAKEAL